MTCNVRGKDNLIVGLAAEESERTLCCEVAARQRGCVESVGVGVPLMCIVLT